MCNLYNLKVERWELVDYYAAEGAYRADMLLEKDYVAPGREGFVCRNTWDGRVIDHVRWGMPHWQAGQRDVVNVRNYASPFWRSMLADPAHRCLVPVTEFQEWSAAPDPATGKKRPYWFSLPAQPIFSFAGIWRGTPTGGRYAFLTTGYLGDPAQHVVGAIHPKAIPVILHRDDEERWLTGPVEEALELAVAYPSQLMRRST